jgi:NADPH:quinone reductase-like Zn-dependent oxidoreductase
LTRCPPCFTLQRMRAIVHDRYGPPDVLQLREVADPVPADGQVLLRVHAAGLDRGAWHVMTGLPYLGRAYFGLRRPRNPVLGMDVAGTVESVGAGVTRFRPGDEVFGTCAGSFAELAVAAEDKVIPKPVGLDFVHAAAVPVSACTALHAVRDSGRVAAGQAVAVNGAGGGVGSYAVQLAKAAGAQVTAVTSTAKVDFIRSLGADHVVDYTREDLAAGGPRFDVILDVGGHPSMARLRRALTPAGTFVAVGGEHGGAVIGGLSTTLQALARSPFTRQRLVGMLSSEGREDLEHLADLLTDGTITAPVERTFPLAEAPEAMRHLLTGRACGKLVLVP